MSDAAKQKRRSKHAYIPSDSTKLLAGPPPEGTFDPLRDRAKLPLRPPGAEPRGTRAA
jgi:hypothetical protein